MVWGDGLVQRGAARRHGPDADQRQCPVGGSPDVSDPRGPPRPAPGRLCASHAAPRGRRQGTTSGTRGGAGRVLNVEMTAARSASSLRYNRPCGLHARRSPHVAHYWTAETSSYAHTRTVNAPAALIRCLAAARSPLVRDRAGRLPDDPSGQSRLGTRVLRGARSRTGLVSAAVA